jgi:spermidine/putrescine transport system substrate-binding protein
VGASALGVLAAACDGLAAGAPSPELRPPAPNHPFTWPISGSNRAIASGLRAERNATLRVFCWADRVNPRCLTDFAGAFKCQVQLTSFATFGHAMQALARGQRFDVLLGAPTYLVGNLVLGGLIQPLNHSYIPNIRNAWPMFTNPYYDSGWRYTVPYTAYTTGIAWRRDLVGADPYALITGWNFPWRQAGTRSAKGKIGVLNNYREALGLALLKDDIDDLSTADPVQVSMARAALLRLSAQAGGLRIGNDTAKALAAGQVAIQQAWSGQVAAAARHLPKGVTPEVLGYWFPPNGRGPVGNDTGTVLRGARSPVLAHLFLNFMMGSRTALTNVAGIGFMQPLRFVTPDRLMRDGILPRNLVSTCVIATDLDHGLKEYQLPSTAVKLWLQSWNAVTRAAK